MTETTRNPRLSLKDLEIDVPLSADAEDVNESAIEAIPDTDPVHSAIKQALLDGYAGVILRGPPGTSKSWYAKRVALAISANDPAASDFVQFHPSYQYEDFIEGWSPNSSGGFSLQPKTFLRACTRAAENPHKTYVLVIDEISRCDAARVFGEALTYLESTKRGMAFTLASGTSMSVPGNLVLIGTMNPWDRGVDEMDVALLRRFAQIEMKPSAESLRDILGGNGMEQRLVDAVARFFEALQRSSNPMLHIGHAYFVYARDGASLERVWELQLRHHFRSACRLEPEELKRLEGMWSQMVAVEIHRTVEGPVLVEEQQNEGRDDTLTAPAA